MKRKSIAIILLTALLLSAFSSLAVFAEADDHGADAQSESMYEVEEDVEAENEGTFIDGIVNSVTEFLPYVAGIICGVVILVIVIKIIKRSRRPKYTGKH